MGGGRKWGWKRGRGGGEREGPGVPLDLAARFIHNCFSISCVISCESHLEGERNKKTKNGPKDFKQAIIICVEVCL